MSFLLMPPETVEQVSQQHFFHLFFRNELLQMFCLSIRSCLVVDVFHIQNNFIVLNTINKVKTKFNNWGDKIYSTNMGSQQLLGNK